MLHVGVYSNHSRVWYRCVGNFWPTPRMWYCSLVEGQSCNIEISVCRRLTTQDNNSTIGNRYCEGKNQRIPYLQLLRSSKYHNNTIWGDYSLKIITGDLNAWVFEWKAKRRVKSSLGGSIGDLTYHCTSLAREFFSTLEIQGIRFLVTLGGGNGPKRIVMEIIG